MVEFPETRESLLLRVRDPRDQEAWAQFVSIYRPIAYRLARLRGLQDADAEELAQQVMLAVSKKIGTWSRSSPDVRFHYWLRRVITNAIHNAISRQPKDLASGGSMAVDLLQGLADTNAGDHRNEQAVLENAEMELAYRRQLVRRAAEIVRARADRVTWQAFVLTTLQGQSAKTAASSLGCSVGSIYAARSRVVRRLRDAVRTLEEQFDATKLE
ncbi:RNA polymerase sigma factor [Aureliella helgolandensis]|uniref:RNA polymerase sigma factor RpoE n=1 Tax=Aureliella helgolandensis TaxID=2527968 RepID=A0A518G9D7_9BACT|nr:sigma-70 family RNA polymerase sigma factor [Aureliella helgolandensis]QDV25180.1 RNA polymerase sigma factor RpoE [Aureliella helgolandensis]